MELRQYALELVVDAWHASAGGVERTVEAQHCHAAAAQTAGRQTEDILRAVLCCVARHAPPWHARLAAGKQRATTVAPERHVPAQHAEEARRSAGHFLARERPADTMAWARRWITAGGQRRRGTALCRPAACAPHTTPPRRRWPKGAECAWSPSWISAVPMPDPCRHARLSR